MVRAESLDLDALRLVFEERKVTKVKLGGFDVDGVLRGKYVSLEKFFSAAQSGLGFCDVIFGWDVGDQLYDNAQVTGWHTGYPDTLATIDLSTFRMIDRKSTRLNSSHVEISYAVFCLKKKKKN